MSDIALKFDSAAGLDFEVRETANGLRADLTTDEGLRSAVLVSLFLDARADADDVLPFETDDRRGELLAGARMRHPRKRLRPNATSSRAAPARSRTIRPPRRGGTAAAWSALMGPPGLPAEVISRWSETVARLAREREWLARHNDLILRMARLADDPREGLEPPARGFRSARQHERRRAQPPPPPAAPDGSGYP